jgi:quinol monooxygenase YgiN
VVIEYIRYTVDSGRREAFEEAYRKAQEHLQASPHCLGYDLARCVKDPQKYVLRIAWDSAEGHLQGFRTSAGFGGFLTLVRPYLNAVQEMEHYEETDVVWKRT